MINITSIKKNVITQKGTLDKRLWYYPHLKKLRLISIKQLVKKCVDKKQCFIPPDIQGVTPGQRESINHSIVFELVKRKILPEIEEKKFLPISIYVKSLSIMTIKQCNKNGITTLGAAIKRCVKNKQFVPVSEKKFTVKANYQLALLLHRKRLITDNALSRVERPHWVLLVPQWDQLGPDSKKYLCDLDWKWDETTIEIIRRSVTRKFRYNNMFYNVWNTISVKELVMTFVRIDSNNKLVFYTKGHYGPYRSNRDFFDEHGPKAFPQIRKFLEEMYYLPRPSQEELDRRFVEEGLD